MFIRKTCKTDQKTGKKYFSYQLMDSYRTERGPRQRMLLNLGSDLQIEDDERKLLANRIEELHAGTQNLFTYPPHIEKLAQTYHRILSRKENTAVPQHSAPSDQEEHNYQTVDLNTLQNEYARSVGLEHIVFETIKKLELDSILASVGLAEREIQVALGVIVGKLCSPASELATHQWLQFRSGIDELMGTDFSRLSRNAVYKVADNLLKHREVIEKQLELKEKDLFSFTDTIVLYDLTNTYFEGKAGGIELAARGKSKEKRSDCPLVTLGLVLNPEGFPKKSCILPGNISEPKTLEQSIKQLHESCNEQLIVVLDAGIATNENLEYLRKHKYKYIVASRSRSCEIPEDMELETVKEERNNRVRVAQKPDQETGEVLIYCHSESRMEKEKGIRSLKQIRLEEDLKLVAAALTKKGGVKSYNKVLERIGRLKERHRTVAKHYNIKVESDESRSKAIEISWEVNEQGLENRFQGAYLLRAYGLEWSSDRLWRTYVMLTRVEEGFRNLKSELGLRPVHHQITRRVEGHLFITVIAYHIMQTILYQLRQSGISIKWKTLRQEMATQVRVTTAMKAKDGRQISVRSSTIAEPAHRDYYAVLGISTRPGKTAKMFI
jgi:transposase